MYVFLMSQVEYAADPQPPLESLREALTEDIEEWALMDGIPIEECRAPYQWLEDNRIDHHYEVRLFEPDRYPHGYAILVCLNTDHTVAMEFALRFNNRPFQGTCGRGWRD